MRYARLLHKLYAEPLLIEESAWRAFDHALRDLMSGRTQFPAVSIDQDEDDAPDVNYRTQRILEIITPGQMGAFSTAIIRLDGVIDKHMSMFELLCYGGVDLDDVDDALDVVAADPSINNVLLVLNSPGGSVIGIPETADKVYALAQKKNVKAFTDSVCCSGGIYIASQASEFFVTGSSYTGSIGVINPPIIDISKALAKEGIKTTTIKSGKFKDTGSMLRPITDEEIAMLQARCDNIMSMFTGAVRRGRPSIQDDAMQGQVFFGREAVDVGLADAIVPDLKTALAQF